MGKAPFVAMQTDLRKEDRVDLIAEITGYNRDEVLGKLFRLWAWCTDRGLDDAPDDCDGYAVPERVVRQFLGERGVEAMLGDGCDELAMAERRPDGLIYLRGTHETVSRLRNLRSTAVAGGDAAERQRRSAAGSGGRGSNGRFVRNQQFDQPTDQLDTSRSPAWIQQDSSSEPSATSEIPQTTDPDPENALSRAIPGIPPTPVTPAAQERAARKCRLLVESWDFAGRAFREVQAEGIDPTAPNMWSGLPAADSPAMKNLRAIVDGLLLGDQPDYDGAAETIRRRVLVAAARARVIGKAMYMTPARMWNRESFEIDAALTPAQIGQPSTAQPRQPRGGPKRAENPQLQAQLAKIARLEAEEAAAKKGSAT